MSSSRKALSAAELQAYADTFTAEEGIDPVRGFDPVKGAFREPAHRAKFTGWLRASVAEKAVQPGDFEAWREARQEKAQLKTEV